jgi:glucosamine-6-phosphate deaminase
MKITKVKNYDELSKVAASRIAELLNAKKDASLGLATGSTPIGLYKDLIDLYKTGKISFKDVKSYNLDEYLGLEKSHQESYYTFMHNQLFNHVDILEDNVNIPEGNTNDHQEACKDYNQLLNNAEIDLQILGIGVNGHIGFNEPGTAFDEETHIVELTDETKESNKRFFPSIEEVPTQAITMGIKNILQAKKILLLISGKSKAETVKRLFAKEISIDFPASALHNHSNVEVIVDSDALSLVE